MITQRRLRDHPTIHAAQQLADLLAIARAHVIAERPHVCARCGRLYQLPSLSNGRHCARCGVETAPAVGWIREAAQEGKP